MDAYARARATTQASTIRQALAVEGEHLFLGPLGAVGPAHPTHAVTEITMGQTPTYAVVRVDDERYRLDRLTPPGIGAAAFVVRFRDRLGNPLGWRLRPLVVMQGARSRIHPTAAAALA